MFQNTSLSVFNTLRHRLWLGGKATVWAINRQGDRPSGEDVVDGAAAQARFAPAHGSGALLGAMQRGFGHPSTCTLYSLTLMPSAAQWDELRYVDVTSDTGPPFRLNFRCEGEAVRDFYARSIGGRRMNEKIDFASRFPPRHLDASRH